MKRVTEPNNSPEDDELRRKIKRYERKLNRLLNVTPEEPTTPPRPDVEENEHEENNIEETEAPTSDEPLPEEFLLALGEEGHIEEKIGESIRPEIAERWENIIKTGITREKWTPLLEKYLTPSNFPKAIAPKLNSELVAVLSDNMIKRDKKFEYRQNLIGKILSCLGSQLTEIMKGNINSLKLIEGINDSAKILCNMYHYDNIVRKHLVLSSLPSSVKQAITNAPTDSYLLGENLGERLKAAKAIERNGTLLQPSNKQAAKKATFKYNKTNLNWKGPSQKTPQRDNRTRGGPRTQQQYQPSQQQYQPSQQQYRPSQQQYQPYQQQQQHQHYRRPAFKPQQSRPSRRR